MEPLVSIIVPVYKVEKYIRECIESITNQTYKKLELLLIDDGTPDKSGEICDEYARRDPRIRVIHKNNEGLGKTRNVGLDHCTGDFIVFLDSDDVMASDYIEYLLGLCLTNEADIAICLVDNFQDGEAPEYDGGKDWPIVKLSSSEALKKFFYMDQIRTGVIGKLFSRKLIKELYNPEGIYYEDARPTYLALCASKTVVLGAARKAGYRERATSQSHQKFSLKEMTCISEMDFIYKHAETNHPELHKAAACRALSANAHIFLMIPFGEYQKELDLCWANIKKFRGTVLKDSHARKKARYFALLALSGKRITHALGKHLVYRGG